MAQFQPPRKIQLFVRVRPALRTALETEAERLETTTSEVTREILEAWYRARSGDQSIDLAA